MLFTYIIPTRNRPDRLAMTLAALGKLNGPGHTGTDAEVVIVDNASQFPVTAPERLASGIPVRTIHLSANEAAAARNRAALIARGRWLVMLDDDSHPLDTAFIRELQHAPADVGAIGAEITLRDGSHEAGALPEVFTGCGVAIRRELFNDLGGYDPTFVYYAEEYDLSARLLIAGHRIVHSRAFRVIHHKDTLGRDRNTILRHLVRNNAWVALRYAPDAERSFALNQTVTRYAEIAAKEHAVAGYEEGLRDLAATSDDQPRRTMSPELWDRFTGVAHARQTIEREHSMRPFARATILAGGKNAWVVRRVLDALGIEETPDPAAAQAIIIGTLSPGPMLDAQRRLRDQQPHARIIAPWRLVDTLAGASTAATMAA